MDAFDPASLAGNTIQTVTSSCRRKEDSAIMAPVPPALMLEIGKSHSSTAGPPRISILRSLPADTNAMNRLSGDQKKPIAPAVSGSGRVMDESMGRTHNASWPSRPAARNAR